MSIGTICTHDVVTIRPTDDLAFAGRLMREKHIGYLVVTNPLATGANSPLGVITDRDIVVAVVAQEVNPRSLTVGDVMTSRPLVLEEGSPVNVALMNMRARGVRRAPVVAANGGLVGVISLDDILSELAKELANIAGAIRTERWAEQTLRP